MKQFAGRHEERLQEHDGEEASKLFDIVFNVIHTQTTQTDEVIWTRCLTSTTGIANVLTEFIHFIIVLN